jgi:cytoskeletal protein RodZ
VFVDLMSVPAAYAVVLVPSQDPPAPPQGEEFGKASPVALVVILALALATFLLIRNMSRRIKRLPESFDDETPEQESEQSEAPEAAATSAKVATSEKTSSAPVETAEKAVETDKG